MFISSKFYKKYFWFFLASVFVVQQESHALSNRAIALGGGAALVSAGISTVVVPIAFFVYAAKRLHNARMAKYFYKDESNGKKSEVENEKEISKIRRKQLIKWGILLPISITTTALSIIPAVALGAIGATALGTARPGGPCDKLAAAFKEDCGIEISTFAKLSKDDWSAIFKPFAPAFDKSINVLFKKLQAASTIE